MYPLWPGSPAALDYPLVTLSADYTNNPCICCRSRRCQILESSAARMFNHTPSQCSSLQTQECWGWYTSMSKSAVSQPLRQRLNLVGHRKTILVEMSWSASRTVEFAEFVTKGIRIKWQIMQPEMNCRKRYSHSQF